MAGRRKQHAAAFKMLIPTGGCGDCDPTATWVERDSPLRPRCSWRELPGRVRRASQAVEILLLSGTGVRQVGWLPGQASDLAATVEPIGSWPARST
jgi:hypothetical protein